MNSSYKHLPEVDAENSKKGGRDTCPLTSYKIENSLKIIQINFKETNTPFPYGGSKGGSGGSIEPPKLKWRTSKTCKNKK